jgi:hypothetical protein
VDSGYFHAAFFLELLLLHPPPPLERATQSGGGRRDHAVHLPVLESEYSPIKGSFALLLSAHNFARERLWKTAGEQGRNTLGHWRHHYNTFTRVTQQPLHAAQTE